MSGEQLDYALTRFIRREDGEEYPGKTLYEMLGSTQAFLRVKCKRNVTSIGKSGRTLPSSVE